MNSEKVTQALETATTYIEMEEYGKALSILDTLRQEVNSLEPAMIFCYHYRVATAYEGLHLKDRCFQTWLGMKKILPLEVLLQDNNNMDNLIASFVITFDYHTTLEYFEEIEDRPIFEKMFRTLEIPFTLTIKELIKLRYDKIDDITAQPDNIIIRYKAAVIATHDLDEDYANEYLSELKLLNPHIYQTALEKIEKLDDLMESTDDYL